MDLVSDIRPIIMQLLHVLLTLSALLLECLWYIRHCNMYDTISTRPDHTAVCYNFMEFGFDSGNNSYNDEVFIDRTCVH